MDIFQDKESPKVVDGEINLKDWDFSADGVVRLDGTWEFYWDELYEPDDFSKIDKLKKTNFFYVPKVWNFYTIDGEFLPGEGYGT